MNLAERVHYYSELLDNKYKKTSKADKTEDL